MQAPGVGLEEMAAVVSGTLLTSMVAEQAGSSGNLRGSELAQALSQAASMAGGEDFKMPTGVSKEVKELALSIGTSVAAKAIGAMCSRRRRLRAQGEEGDDEHAEQEDDKLSETEPSEFEMKNMSPNQEAGGKGSHPSPKIGAGLVTPQANPERHDLTLSHIKKTRSETSENSLERMMDMTMNTAQRRDRTENFLKNLEEENRRRDED